MSRLCTALVAAGLVLCAYSGMARVAAQVRDRPLVAAPNGTLSGRVEIDVSRQRMPVRRARVTLTADAGATPSTTLTDTDGRYRFDRVAAGAYRVRAEKPGFVPMPADPARPSDPPAPVHVTAGDAAMFDVLMQRGAALDGQFVDDHGHPIPHLVVYADRIVGPAESPAGVDRHAATTDDLGRFHLHTLSPGRYYLHASPPPPASGGELYYPGTSSTSQATVLAVAAGQTIGPLAFNVAAAPRSPIAAAALAASESDTTRAAPVDPRATRVAGQITRSDNGEPIANATVRMLTVRGAVNRTARSQADGRFEFSGVPADSYVLTVTAAGYVSADGSIFRQEGAGRTIEVKDREQIDGVDLSLAPPGTIEGRVLDEFGDPAPGISIQVSQPVEVAGVARLMAGATTSSIGPTDDRGWFRTGALPSGNYYVLALSGSLSGLTGLFASGSPSPDVGVDGGVGFAPTFFPGTASLDAATPVRVRAGVDARDMTFALVAARMVAIAGTALDSTGQPAANARVMLVQTQGDDVRTMVGTAATATANGAFRFPAVPEGTYVLQGFGTALTPEKTQLFGSLPVMAAATPTGAPLDVTLTLRPRITARGAVSFDGDAARPRDPSSVSIYVRPTSFTSGPVGGNALVGHINAAWSFEIPNLASTGVLGVIAPPGWWLKNIRLDGRDITDTPYDFQTADVNGLEIVLTSRVGAVAGTVMDAGRPAAHAIILIFSDDVARWEFPSRPNPIARSDQQGVFSLQGLLPGRYLAVALPLEAIAATGPPSLATLRPFATPVQVSEGISTALTLTVIKR